MKDFIVWAFVAFISGVLTVSPEHLAKWESFKAKHGKVHPPHEEEHRMKRFLQRDADIEAHNARYAAGLESFSRQHSRYSDLSEEEVDRAAFGLIPLDDDSEMSYAEVSSSTKRPDSLNWRSMIPMTPVKDQGECGSCYAFAATGVLEAYLSWKNKGYYSLSEQSIIDCSIRKYARNRQNQGCVGGFPGIAFLYFNDTDVITEDKYPYVSGTKRRPGTCDETTPRLGLVKGKLMNRRVVKPGLTEDEVADLLYEKGPLAIALAADRQYKQPFIDYQHGILDLPNTSNDNPNHAVVLVGYGEEGGKQYWIIRNSWGPHWGDQGYGKIRRGTNMCNLLKLGVWYVELME